MRILTIGSRSESELFCLYAAGFEPKNIEAVDLISYTPLIRSGDAHKLAFPDGSFDIIIAGWVLAYSRTPWIMAEEIMRVAAPHAYVAAGCAYTPPGRGAGSTAGINITGSRFSSIEDITKLFQKRLSRVLFQSPIERERVTGSAALATVMQMDG
jgi:ubiquinone/menaquinone biosynthesis C-methylase UbiE